MRSIASVILILFFYNIYSQNFPKLYPLKVDGSLFANIISKNDTLIVYGSTIDTLNKRWGIYLGKVDTFGKVLLDTTYFDSSSNYLVELNYPILSDNKNYYITGNIYNRSNIYFKKLGENFNAIFTKEIISGSDVTYVNNLLKINNNKFLLGGSRSLINNKFIGYYHFIDTSGNIILSKTINENDKYGAVVNTFYKVNNNIFLITGTIGYSDTSSKSRILTIDSLGNIINTWYSKENEHLGIRKMILLSDSSIIYTTVQYKIVNNDGIQRTLLVKRDKNMNVLWQRTFNEEWSMFYNQPIDLKETPDGNYILAHDKGSIKNSTKPNVLLSCLYKFNANGDSIWSREDTVIYSEKFGVANKMGGITVLPSGSIVVCGYSNAPIDGSVRSIAWLYKVNKDGCMDFCNTTGFLDLEATEQKLKVFPNPTSNNITVSAQNPINDYEVYNIYGQCILKNYFSSNQITLNVENWQNGIYYLKTKDSFGKINSVNILVQK